MRHILFFVLLACSPILIPSVVGTLTKWEATNFCKCICFQSNYTILRMQYPDDPSKPCLSCTKQWCLDRNLTICAGASLGDTDPDTATGKEGDVEARCFQRDSPRDQLVVTLFLLTVFGLLLGAGVKHRMVKAGINLDAASAWDVGRRWWETLLPKRHQERFDLSDILHGNGHARSSERPRDRRNGEYVSISDSPPTP